MTKFVVPDTNVLFSDLFLEQPSLSTIRETEQAVDLRVLFPAVVIDELRNKLEERLDQLDKDAGKLRHDLTRLTGTRIGPLDFEVASRGRRFISDRFERRILQLHEEKRVIPYPSTSLEELAHRSIRTTPPFSGEDKGLRDTLIWLSIKEHLANAMGAGSKVILVTRDGAFYADKRKTALSESLSRELEDLGVPRDAVSAV